MKNIYLFGFAQTHSRGSDGGDGGGNGDDDDEKTQ